MCRTEPEDSLLLYVVVSDCAMSLVLIKEEETRKWPVYYVSRALTGVEKNYPKVKKVTFAIVITARKLRPYFW